MAILFDMNKLFEEFTYRILKRFAPADVTVGAQIPRNFWGKRKRRPDLVIEKAGKISVIDTKWKVPDERGPSDEDLNQMYVYSDCFNCEKPILLYPKIGKGIDMEDAYNVTKEGKQVKCAMKSYELVFVERNIEFYMTYENLRSAINIY